MTKKERKSVLVSYFSGGSCRVCFGKCDVSLRASVLHLCDGDCFACESLHALDCLWKKEFKFKKLASILTMLFMLPLQLWAIKIIDVNGISLLFLLIPEIIAMFILAWFMMKEMIIEEKYK